MNFRQGSRHAGSGSWIPWLFVAFFGVVLAANLTMVWIGYASWTGLVTDRAYDEGLQYDRVLDALERQRRLGWQVEIEAALEHGLDGRLTMRAREADGRPLEGARARVRFVRPTLEGHDFTIELKPRGEGRYAADFTLPLAGVWDLHLELRRGADRFLAVERAVLR